MINCLIWLSSCCKATGVSDSWAHGWPCFAACPSLRSGCSCVLPLPQVSAWPVATWISKATYVVQMKVKITVASFSSLHTQTLVRDLISQCEVLQCHRKPSGASWWISKHCPLRFFAQPDVSPSLPWWPNTLFSDVHQDPWLITHGHVSFCVQGHAAFQLSRWFSTSRVKDAVTHAPRPCCVLYQNGEMLSSFSNTSWNSLTGPEESCLGLSTNTCLHGIR